MKRIVIVIKHNEIQHIMADEVDFEIRILNYDIDNIDGLNRKLLTKVPTSFQEGQHDLAFYQKQELDITHKDHFDSIWNLPTANQIREEIRYHELVRHWIELNGFGDRSLEDIANHELDETQLRYYNFLMEEFAKL